MMKSARLISLSLVAAAAAMLAPAGDTLVAPASAQASTACTIPTKPAATPDQTAWELFVAVNCRAANGKLVWENWIEQATLYPASGAPGALAVSGRRLHGSVLAALLHPASGPKGVTATATPGPCNKMAIAPSNVTTGATICEEVHINPSAQATIQKNGYQYRTGQMATAAAGGKISFGTDAIEVKIDWLPASDFASPSFSCSAATAPTVYVETIDGVCYAMVAMHVTSHLIPNWIWTTFEPQNDQTNPFRCAVYGPCLDKWGVKPSVAIGATSNTTLTPALAALMKQAKLAPGFENYRLVGAQTDFTSGGRAILNGNSITEYEAAGTAAGESSCISCHSMSSINATGVDGGAYFATNPSPIGAAVSLPVGFITRGFLWSMALACPNPTNTGFQACTAPPPKK